MGNNHEEKQLSLFIEIEHTSNSSGSSPILPCCSEKEHFHPRYAASGVLNTDAVWTRTPSSFSILIRPRRIFSLIWALLPSFLQRSYDYKSKIHPTSWLDGLRGVAALFVFVHHFALIWFPSLSAGYASVPGSYWFFQLPFLRVFYSGRGMVSLFFVISGYALSYSTLRKIRAGNFPAVFETLSSSVFRRWVRLFLPILVSTFLAMMTTRMGWVNGPSAPRTETFGEQFWHWWGEFVRISNPVMGMGGGEIYSNVYSLQLWTIPREMRGSMVTYVVLLCVARTKQTIKIVCMVFFTWYMLYIQQWDLFLFLSGMLCAELDLIRADHFPDCDSTVLLASFPPPISRNARTILHTTTALISLLSLHLLTFPDAYYELTPGYVYIFTHTPATYQDAGYLPQRFWIALGSPLLILAMSLSPTTKPSAASSTTPLLQRPFNTPFAQYLGKISFALYITHHIPNFTIGSRFFVWAMQRQASPGMYLWGFVGACVAVGGSAVWGADLFWRLVDARSVRFAKAVEGWCFV